MIGSMRSMVGQCRYVFVRNRNRGQDQVSTCAEALPQQGFGPIRKRFDGQGYLTSSTEPQCVEPLVWTSGSALRCRAHSFWGRRRVCVVADHCHHGEREHDQRYVAMPSMPRSGFVVVEAEFVLGRLEAVLDRPAVDFGVHERVDPGPGRAPGREERQFAVRDMSSDQQAAGPHPLASFTVIGSLDVREFEIGPVVQSCTLRALACRQAMPSGGIEILSDLACRAENRGLPHLGAKVMVGANAEDIAFPGSA